MKPSPPPPPPVTSLYHEISPEVSGEISWYDEGNIDYFNVHWDKVAHTNVHEALFICIIYSYLIINPNFKYALFFICTIKMSFHIISQYHFTSHCSKCPVRPWCAGESEFFNAL